MTYPGGKAGSGVYQTIINQMPPHDVYIEPFLGGAAIMQRKRPARLNIGLDLDPQPVAMAREAMPEYDFKVSCGIDFLSSRARKWTGQELVYCDPPYVLSSRLTQREIYRYEMGDLHHAVLLAAIKELPCMVMISGYASPLYDTQLRDWRRIEYEGQTRGGRVTEVLWMNFPAPLALHDYRFLGDDYRQRENIVRKVRRWRGKFAGLNPLERQAILGALLEP